MDAERSRPSRRSPSITLGSLGDGSSSRSRPTRRKKRGRHAAACDSCHRRKQKCDGARPCFNCSRRGVATSCAYSYLSSSSVVDNGEPRTASSHFTPQATIIRSDVRSPPGHPVNGGPEGEDLNLGHPTEHGVSTQGRAPDAPEHPVGDLFKSRDAPSFFGSSYFGPQAAAKVIQAPPPDLSSGIQKAEASSTHSFRDEGGPFSQIWDLLGLLPRKKSTVDKLTECFLNELNWAIDSVHPTSFRRTYQHFWARKFGFDDLATIDLRWLALLFIILAYGVLLDCPRPRNKEVQREVQETSQRFYWASRRAIVIAPTFYGESTDLVRAGVLVTRYLIYTRRIPESWLTTSFAMRMAQAQGMHIDGERWRLPRKETETRRRLWSHLYRMDKTIALALGRPFAIVDQQCLVKQASNLWLDDLTDEEAENAVEAPISEPTLSVCNRLCHQLAVIVGRIQEQCFGLFTVSYDTVLALDLEITAWESRLPGYFRLTDPDRSMDKERPFLVWNRLHLHSLYHFARVTLHRPFLLRQSITNRYAHSHDVCMASSCADLEMRLKYFSQPLTDRLKWSLGSHHLFNSALILGIIIVRDPHSRQSQAILEDLVAYCELQKNDTWLNEFALAEVKIVELCIKKAKQLRSSVAGNPAETLPRPAPVPQDPMSMTSESIDTRLTNTTSPVEFLPSNLGMHGPPGVGMGPVSWDDPSLFFPETGDLLQWEHVLNSIMNDQMVE